MNALGPQLVHHRRLLLLHSAHRSPLPNLAQDKLGGCFLLTRLLARTGQLMPPGTRRGQRSQASQDARWARFLAAKERAKQEGTPFVPHSRDPTLPKRKAKAKPSQRPRTPSAPSAPGPSAAPDPPPPDAAIPALEETLDPGRPATPRLPWADRWDDGPDEAGSHRRRYTLIC